MKYLKQRIRLLLIFSVTSLGVFWLMKWVNLPEQETSQTTDFYAIEDSTSINSEEAPREVLYGMVVDSLIVIKDIVKPFEHLGKILSKYSISNQTIDQLATKAKEVFDPRKIRTNHNYTVLCNADSSLRCFVYEPNAQDYIVFNVQDSIHIYKGQKQAEVVRKSVAGIIQNNLYDCMIEQGASPALVNYLVDLFAWQVDFFKLQKNDKFKIIYEEKEIENIPIGGERILAAYFEGDGKPQYAFYFEQDSIKGYYNELGKSMKKPFLNAPLNYTRISSRYTRRRFHPVQKRYKAHLGTDYAAPRGTPIRAVGDGKITRSGYARYNGNYVKIKHNATYSTQYLHMSKIAKGMRVGTKVSQGQVIGYVGSTGLATGPHLCFRFWKNGRQVDPLSIKLPPAKPLPASYEKDYLATKDAYLKELNEMDYPQIDLLAFIR